MQFPYGLSDFGTLIRYGEGLLKTVFKAVKAGAGGLGLDRVLITGVSPIVLSDLTSGYNVGENIDLDDAFNDLCGFTEPDIAAALARLAAEGDGWSAATALETLRIFYNGYRFSPRAAQRLYNPTLSLYFLKRLSATGRYPDWLLDENLAMDRNKLFYIAALPHGEELLIRALDAPGGIVIPQLARRFGVADVLDAVKDRPFMASLLYYFGILTLDGQTDFNEIILSIPNLVARSLYVKRLRDGWLDTYEDKSALPPLTKAFYQQGDLAPLGHSNPLTIPMTGGS